MATNPPGMMQAQKLLVNVDTTTVTIENEDQLVSFAVFIRSDDAQRAQPVEKLVLNIPSLSPRTRHPLLQLIPQLSQLTKLWVLHAERLFSCCPVLGDCIVDRASLTELKFAHAGGIAYSIVARLRTRLESVHVSGFPGDPAQWNATAALLLPLATTLREIDMPNVALDLRARKTQFPQVRIIHITYDRPAIFDLGAYKFAFPNLQDFRLAVTPASPGPAEQEALRLRNLLAGIRERGWEGLLRVRAPPHHLWLLGLHTPVHMLSLPIGPGGASAQRMLAVLAALSPKHLHLDFQSTPAARAVMHDFGVLLGPLRVPRLTTLVLTCHLPLVQFCFSHLLVDLVRNVADLHCEELTVRFIEHVPTTPQRPPRMRPTYAEDARWDALTLILLAVCRRVKRVIVLVPKIDRVAPRMYTASANSPQGVPISQ